MDLSSLIAIKYKIFRLIHHYPIEIWVMWGILILFVFAIIIRKDINFKSNKKLLSSL
jgi:hypothetical protein